MAVGCGDEKGCSLRCGILIASGCGCMCVMEKGVWFQNLIRIILLGEIRNFRAFLSGCNFYTPVLATSYIQDEKKCIRISQSM